VRSLRSFAAVSDLCNCLRDLSVLRVSAFYGLQRRIPNVTCLGPVEHTTVPRSTDEQIQRRDAKNAARRSRNGRSADVLVRSNSRSPADIHSQVDQRTCIAADEDVRDPAVFGISSQPADKFDYCSARPGSGVQGTKSRFGEFSALPSPALGATTINLESGRSRLIWLDL
jgi:hypothetical protein